jgi:hypothetical protein
MDGARLRAFLACFFRKPHLCPERELLEPRRQHTVTVKIHFPSVGRFYKAVTLLRE